MEEREQKWVRAHLAHLVPLTTCTSSVLMKLQTQNFLSQEEVDWLQNGDMVAVSKSYKLYITLMKRSEAYGALINILDEEKQTGAVKILKQYYRYLSEKNRQSSISEGDTLQFETTLPHLQLLSSSTVISTPSCDLTMKRVKECAQLELQFRPMTYSKRKLGETSEAVEEFIQRAFVATISIPEIKRYIIVVHTDDLHIVLENFGEAHVVVFDHFTWGDMKENFKQNILSKKLQFQGRIYTLDQICFIYQTLTTNDHNKLLNHLEDSTLINLLEDNVPEICSGNIPPPPKEYIPRQVMSRRHVSRKILAITEDAAEFKDILVFRRVELYDLQLLVSKYGNGRCDISTNVIMNEETITSRNILLEQDSDFTVICKRAIHQPVHLFDCKKEKDSASVRKLVWVQSFNSLSCIPDHIHNLQNKLPESILGENLSPSPVLISDSPGTGKSTLMAKLAGSLTTDNAYVQYIVMGEFIKEFISDKDESAKIGHYRSLSSSSFNIANELKWENMWEPLQVYLENKILKVLTESLSQSNFEQLLFQSIIKSEKVKWPIRLFFDGLDEVLPNQVQLAKLILDYFVKYKHGRYNVWVATRPHLLDELEEHYCVLGHTLKPFENNHPIFLLTKLWYDTTLDEQRRTKLEAFAKVCLELVAEKMTDKEKEMAGTPLICRLLGHVYKDDAIQFSATEFHQDINTNSIHYHTLTENYMKFIEKKFDIATSMFSKEWNRENLNLGCMELAIQLLFPKIHANFPHLFVAETDLVTKRAILSLGIVQHWNKNVPPRFIHRTLADYFCAAAVKELLKRLENDCGSDYDQTVNAVIRPLILLLLKVLKVQQAEFTIPHTAMQQRSINSFKFKSHNICYFLTNIMEGWINHNIISRLTSAYFQYFTNSTSVSITSEPLFALSTKLWNTLNAAIVSNFYGIAHWVTECMKVLYPPGERYVFRNLVSQESNFMQILYCAAKFGNKKMMDCICQFFELWESENVINIENSKVKMSLLHVAVEAGDDEIVEYLLNSKGYKKQIHRNSYANLLNCCLENTHSNGPVTIEKRKKIISLLANQPNGSYFLADDICIPLLHLMLKKVHLELLIFLLNVVQRKQPRLPNFVYSNERGHNIFHLLPTTYYDINVNPERYHHALQSLGKLFNYDICVRNAEEYPRESFPKEAHEDDDDEKYNCKCHLERRFMYLSESNGEKDTLDEYESQLDNEFEEIYPGGGVSDDSSNELYSGRCSKIEDYNDVAGSSEDEGVVENEEVFEPTSDTDFADEDNSWLEDHNHNFTRIPALKLYLESINTAGWTPVHVAVSCLDLLDETLDFFCKNKIDLNLSDHRGSTCIYKAVAGHRSPDFLRRLISKGARYTHRKKMGEHLLHVAAAYYNFEAVKLFVEELKQEVNVTDSDGNTPLHVCFRKHYRGIFHETNAEVEIEPNNQHKIISFLIHNGADIEKPNNNGETPLQLAVQHCGGMDTEIYRQLTDPKTLFKNKDYLTLALKGIVLNSGVGSIWHPALITPFAEELIKCDADVSQTDKKGATLLHLSAQAHSIGVEFLLERGFIAASSKDHEGKNALMYMSCYKDPAKCKVYNCQKIRNCLLKAMEQEK